MDLFGDVVPQGAALLIGIGLTLQRVPLVCNLWEDTKSVITSDEDESFGGWPYQVCR